MKIRVWEIIVFTVLIVLAITFSLLQGVWSGFSYFSSSIFLIFMIFFINNRIYYLRLLKQRYDDGLETYFVELYNNGLITKDQFENVDEAKTYIHKLSNLALLLGSKNEEALNHGMNIKMKINLVVCL